MIEREIILISGPFKSGTSLLCSIIERLGYNNPVHITSPIEYGHGTKVNLYQTRECHIVRDINKKLLTVLDGEKADYISQIKAYLEDMFYECGNRIVIKDPYLMFSLDIWAMAATKVNASLSVYITVRDLNSLHRSWKNSSFLSRMMKKYPVFGNRICVPLTSGVLKRLKENKAKLEIVSYNNLIEWKQIGTSSCLTAINSNSYLIQNCPS